ncbi:lipopolysaccharide assembly protein LapB [Moritella viscosa]
MFELLFLLLPVAAAYGWYMGRRNGRYLQQDKQHTMSREYVTGLNFLLSDQPDKAVDLFIDLLDVDSETIDTHLALGNLFRQRGEVQRAIKIHQNLIARPSLTHEQRNLALLQLARDYLAAGLVDRAEELFLKLIDEHDHRQTALSQLIIIYEQTKEWEQAIAIGIKLKKKRLASLKKALQHDKQCVRASIMLADFYIEQNDYKKAIVWLEHVMTQDIDFVTEILQKLKDCYTEINNEDGFIHFLNDAQNNKAGISVAIALADFTVSSVGLEPAEKLILNQIVRTPTMKGFYHLMQYQEQAAEEGKAKESLAMLRSLVGEQLKLKPIYRCSKCGFSTKRIYWHCPSCKRWGSVKPIRGLDGE